MFFPKAGAKVLLFFELTKYFEKKMQKIVFFLPMCGILSTFALDFDTKVPLEE